MVHKTVCRAQMLPDLNALRVGAIAVGMFLAILARTDKLAAASPEELFLQHCASCHGADRLGALGPALLPENLGRLRPAQAIDVILKGRPATQMPSFSNSLSADDAKQLAAYVFQPLKQMPQWGESEIRGSMITHKEPASLPARPEHKADPLNLFVVVESGDHHVSILDGDSFDVLRRFESRFALHGGPKFTPDGRFVFFASRDGWVTKFDLFSLEVVCEVRAGINTRNIAISADGRFIAAANYLPNSIVLLDSRDLAPLKVIEATDTLRKTSSRVSAVYQAPNRKSFIAAMKDIPEIWEIATDENAPPVYKGLVHSHEKGMVEGLASGSGLFVLRRIMVDEPLDDFMFDPEYRHLLGSTREGGRAVVVNLNVGRTIATIPMEGLPHLGSGITFMQSGRRFLATPHINRNQISIIDMADWKLVKTIPMAGPGFFMRSHEKTPYAWTDTMMGKSNDAIVLIDKRTLEVARELRPSPGKVAAHTEFSRDGRRALVSVWDNDGAIVVYDTETLKEIKRLPMVKPSGKYNVYNKITFSEGTSH